MAALAFLTLSTADVVMVDREDVDADILAGARDLVAKVIERGAAPLPAPFKRYGLALEKVGDVALFTIVAMMTDQGILRPIVHFGVAPRSRGTRKAWERLVDTAAAVFPDARGRFPPPAPWCAAAILPGLLDHPEAAHWLAGAEQAIAWAWLERDRG